MNTILFKVNDLSYNLSNTSHAGYIVGMIIGTILIAICLCFLMYIFIKNRVYRKLIKRVGIIAEQAINSDISLWARHTRNKFIPASLFRYQFDNNKNPNDETFINNAFFEVDSLILTDRALIVVEIKSIKGGIRGSANDKMWTKVSDKSTFAIKNAVLENDEHIKHIRAMLSERIPMISLIIFSNKATFIDLTDLPSHVVVTKHTDIFNTLDEINQSLEPVIDKEMKRKILRKLKGHITNKSRDRIMHEQIMIKGQII